MAEHSAIGSGYHRSHYGLRFVSDAVETAYREWRNDRNLPLYRLAVLVSIPIWAVLPWLLTQALPELIDERPETWRRALILCYGVAIPTLLFALWFIQSSWKQYSTRLSWINLLLLALIQQWTMLWSVESVPGAVAYAILFAAFALFMRLPPRMAAFASVIILLPSALACVDALQSNPDARLDTVNLLVTLPATWFVIVIISVVIERSLRNSFVDAETIQQQNTALQQTRDLIRRYIPPSVASQIIAGNHEAVDAPRRQRVTILFSDIVGFTDIADRVEPEVMTQVISEYMAAMSDIVDAHQGTVNEFIGDGLMALFGAPDPLDPETQAKQAILSARAMQARLPALNKQWRKLGLGETLQIRIGINTGMVSVGSYGSEGRMTYTAIGLQTNIAARIQSHCQSGSILVSEATYHLVEDVIDCEAKGDVECKGVHFPVKVYAPV